MKIGQRGRVDLIVEPTLDAVRVRLRTDGPGGVPYECELNFATEDIEASQGFVGRSLVELLDKAASVLDEDFPPPRAEFDRLMSAAETSDKLKQGGYSYIKR